MRHRNFRLFWSGQVLSLMGTWMQRVAQSWLVYRLTDSPLMLGLVNVVSLLPVIPISLYAGVISDRFPRKKIILFSEFALMVFAIILALLTWSGIVQIWHVILLSFGVGAAAAIEQPTRQAFILDIVGKKDITNAIALNASVKNVARIFGPALTGILVAWTGEAIIFFINGISYFFVITALIAIRVSEKTIQKEIQGMGKSLLNGLKYIWTTNSIRAIMAIVAVSSFFTLPYIVLMPIFADDVLDAGPEGVGFLMASVGFGAFIGALGVANIRENSQEKWLAWGGLAAPIFLVLFTISRSFSMSIILIILVALSNIVRQTLSNSLLQTMTDEAFHGRVMSVFNILFVGMSQTGGLLAGAIAEYVGAPLSIGIGAVISVIWGVYILVRMPHIGSHSPLLNQ